MIDINDVKLQAEKELEEEEFKELVEQYKEKLREKRSRSWFRKLFPYKILIINQNKGELQ